jgi:hypothetical protein
MAITGIVRQQSRSTIVAQNFAPKPNVALSELTDTNLSGVQDGYTLVFNSDTGKYEAAAAPPATVTEIKGGSF